MIEIAGGPYTMTIDPHCGGSVSALAWNGKDVLRRQSGDGVLESACFPLVPFCNRIADSTFAFGGREVTLAPNHPGNPDDLVLHGYGWISQWEEQAAEPSRAVITYDHPAGEWPWPFRAVQTFFLSEAGASFALALTNLSNEPMPAGLGFHPYFPSDGETYYRGLHRGEWQADERILPRKLDMRGRAIDWWEGCPVHERQLDTVYEDREGPLTIAWPRRGLGVEIGHSTELRFTHVYVPPSGDYFCVEPVSQIGDALNAQTEERGFRALAPGETWTVTMTLRAYPLSRP